MSNFYLCDYCEKKLDEDHLNTCECLPFNGEHRKKPIHDSQEPKDVCRHFVKRTEE